MKKPFNKAIRILLTTNGFILIASAMLAPIYALFVEEIGGDLLSASYAFAVFAFVAGVTTLFSGKYADKLKNNSRIMVFGYGLIGLGFLGFTLVSSVVGLLIIQVVIGIGHAVYSPAFDAAYSEHLDTRKSGREWGAWEAINYFTAAAGAILGGLFVTLFGFDAMFIIMALLCFMSAAYIFRLPKRIL